MVNNQQNGKIPITNGFSHTELNNHYVQPQPGENAEIIVFGSIVQDLVSYVERFPKPGEAVRGQSFKTFCGGKGANQAVMAAKLGTRAAMVAYVGEDIFSENNKNSIAQSGVDISSIQTLKGQSTGTACVSVTADGENSIIVTLGANEQLGAKRAREMEAVISRAKMVMCQQEVDQAGNLEAFRIAKEHGVTTFFNPAPGTADMDRNILALSDIICANENEAEFLTGLLLKTMEDAEKCALKILELGPRIAIVTLGPKGALVAQRSMDGKARLEHVDAPSVKAVDTVGAGDCFCGSLAHFLLLAGAKNSDDGINSTVAAVQKAVQIAALSVQKHGAQASYPDREELKRLGLLG